MTAYRDRLIAGEYTNGPAAEPDAEVDEPANGELVCAECGRSFKSEHGLSIHMGKAHADEEDGA